MTNSTAAERVGQLSLFGDDSSVETAPAAPAAHDPDTVARAFAVDPRNNVVLEASAGTGKTSVLVARYVNLLKAGVDPANILAITFTRKAAAEMRERIITELRVAAARSEFDKARWIELRDRLPDIAISTIDAFCLSLVREFPLEADVDPGFEMADETEVPRLVEQSLDRSLRILTSMARSDADIALVLAQLGLGRTREGLATLLERRLVARDALDRFLVGCPPDLTADVVCRRAASSLQDVLRAVPGGLVAFLADGPSKHPRYQLLVRELQRLHAREDVSDAWFRGLLDRVAAHFLTADGKPRRSGSIHPYRGDDYSSTEASRRHRNAAFQVAPQIERVVFSFSRDLNALLARGIRRMFALALDEYRRALEDRSVLDFSDVLERALALLRQMDEFAQSRFRLESRYHHVLVDEFQDTSRAQWELVSLLIRSWGEGAGLATSPSIFVVGDRKQSIYRFRDAEVTVLREAARHIDALRPDSSARRSITRSFRALPELLQFANDLFSEIGSQAPIRQDDFSYGEDDRFPVSPSVDRPHGLLLGIAAADDPAECAAAVAAEVERILREETVRDRQTGISRGARPGDIAILFRSRASHRDFESALELRGIPCYVYKGLGFFDADETKDLTALLRYLARPSSNLRAAALLRSRFVRLSDAALAALAPDLAAALTGPVPACLETLGLEDQEVLALIRRFVPGWLAQVDRVPPAGLIESILVQAAYAYELRGARRLQAWENLKKMRGLVRRIQNRGYATLTRIADHMDALTAGDESNAVLEALDAVNLMTVHAAKGLEFPVVFVVNMAKGSGGPPAPVRVIASGGEDPSVSVGPFVSDADEGDRERERHETKRLLYVAITRARDRLYLSSYLKDGALVSGRGSLGEVLPPSIAAVFGRAATAFRECPAVAWTGSSGRTYEWRICRAPFETPPAVVSSERQVTAGDGRSAAVRKEIAGIGRRTTTVTAAVGNLATALPPAGEIEGRLVHRLLARRDQLDRLEDPSARIAWTRSLLSNDEAATLVDPDATAVSALEAWNELQLRPDVSTLFETGRALHEVPFTFRDAGTTVRGAVDCLIHTADGRLVVLEFKTGSPSERHRAQLDLYVRAVRQMFPGRDVEGHLVYA